MKYSIILSTYNQLATMPRALDALSRQTFKDFEVHICDDGSSDGTDTFFSNAQGLSFPWHYHYQKNTKSYAKNLNQGIRAAEGEYCLMFNADSFPDIDYLEVLNDYAEPHRIVCGIRIQIDDDVAVDIDWRLKKQTIPNFTVLCSSEPWNKLTGNGLCVPTEAFRDYGLYDERFLVNDGEDNELIARLYQKGYLCYSVPDLHLYHHWHHSNDKPHDERSLLYNLVTQYAR
jgi:GT2 family glycosyltransferase